MRVEKIFAPGSLDELLLASRVRGKLYCQKVIGVNTKFKNGAHEI